MGLGTARACTVHVVGDMKVAGLQLIALSEPLQLQPLHPFLVPGLRAGEIAEMRHLECHLPKQPSGVTDPYNGSIVCRLSQDCVCNPLLTCGLVPGIWTACLPHVRLDETSRFQNYLHLSIRANINFDSFQHAQTTLDQQPDGLRTAKYVKERA